MNAWREISDEDLAELRLHMLDCSALSREAIDQVRGEFGIASVKALKTLARHLQRPPTQKEADLLHAQLVGWFNAERIPLMTPEIVH